MNKSYWIWYPGDMELYYGMKQNFSRVERGYGWPAFWKSEGFRNRIVFRRTYELEKETEFCVYSRSIGYVLAGDQKYPFGKTISCGPGRVQISVHAGCIETFPSIYIKGDVICSDRDWMAEDYSVPPVEVGYSRYFTHPEQDPSCWEYSEKIFYPVNKKSCGGGVLFEFETELTAELHIQTKKELCSLTVCCGESMEEALDPDHCYYSWHPDPDTGKCPCCAVRFAFIPRCELENVDLYAVHQYVDIPVKAAFKSSDSLMNRIWQVSEHTFRLCSGIFFIDGVKRDKWIWSGDAYQSFFVNQYLMADSDIDQRTLMALRGNDPMTAHINTIVDYSLLWILGVKKHLEAYGDLRFVRQIYPKMCSLMEFCENQTDAHGFLTGREKDWIYIDWADLDKEGPLCAEQMLYGACWKAMGEISSLLGMESSEYYEKYQILKEAVSAFFWDEEKGAYIDSFVSGRRHVTRHGNIFAVLFEFADKDQQEKIIRNVICNEKIPAITTPYFKFFELDMLCRIGRLDQVFQTLKEYWGGMLERGAVTFWEEFDPGISQEEQYDMYGDRFGKSLCHAWAASPIYFLAKYFVGLKLPDTPGNPFSLEPRMEFFSEMHVTLPVFSGIVEINWDSRGIRVYADCDRGVLKLGGKEIAITPGEEYYEEN